jgi:hypothetical protein
MRIPVDCPYSRKLPPREAAEAIACCRIQSRYRLLREDEKPLCRTIRTEAEVYRFTWRSSFDGDAVVRIGRQGDEITMRCAYRSYLFGDADRRQVTVTISDWGRLQDALIAASFWALGPEECRRGLDGSNWLIEGRSKDIYRAVDRWSPSGAIYDLGKQFFELAGSPLAEVSIY